MYTLRIIRELSKSGIVTLVLISVFAGFLIGKPLDQSIHIPRLLLTLIGLLLLSCGASALNQIQEINRDALMPRTAKRPLPSGRISLFAAIAFSVFTIIFGLLALAAIDPLLLGLGLTAVILYNGFYTLWWKAHFAHAAVPGAIPGAIPIYIGYLAARAYQPLHIHSLFLPGAIYLFLILFFWQMPHFWVLALHYSKDYALGGIPTLPVSYGPKRTIRQIAIWALCYMSLALMAPLFIPGSKLYLAIPMDLILLVELIRYWRGGKWIRFFMWVNVSLIIFLLGLW